MNRLNRNLLIAPAGILMLVIGLIYLRGSREAAATPNAIIIKDCSPSASRVCDCVRGIALQTFNSTAVGETFSLRLLGTGDAKSANDPVSLLSFLLPKQRRMFEGRSAFERLRQQRLKELADACAQAEPTNSTPLFQALKTAAADLNQTDLKARALHSLYVVTDGQETEEVAVRALLAGQSPSKIKLPPKIDNHQIRIVFYGLAQTIGRETAGEHSRQLSRNRTAASADRLQKVWSNMFSHPQLVSFQPFCPLPDQASSAIPAH